MPLRDQHSRATHAHSRPALSCLLQVLQATHKQAKLINSKEAFTTLISLLKPQTMKEASSTTKEVEHNQNHNIPLPAQIRSRNMST
jgi:hypothetical protein